MVLRNLLQNTWHPERCQYKGAIQHWYIRYILSKLDLWKHNIVRFQNDNKSYESALKTINNYY